jgi:hypothetical protein
MQDNANQHMFDKKFVNASWIDMKLMLDKDIPVVSTPINKVIVVLSTLLFISLFTIGYLVYNQTSNIPTAELTKEHYIYKNIYLNQDKDILKTEYSKQTFEFTTPSLHNKLSNFSGEASEKNYSASIVNNSHSLIDNQNAIAQNYLLNKLPNLDQIITSLKPIDTNEIKLSENLAHKNSNNLNQKSKVKYNLGLLSFVSSNSNFSGYGFTTGVHLPISKRVGIQTGLAVNFVTRNFLVFPFFGKTTDNFKSLSPLDQEETYYDGLKSFKQIYLPVNLNYAISNALSINSGVKFRYTYSQEIDNILETRASKTISKSETVENAFFSNSNIGLSLGVNYQVNKNLNFILDSEWGMNSLINKDQFKNPSNDRYDLNLINLTTSISF